MKTKRSVEHRYNAERAAFVLGFSGRDVLYFDTLVYANVCSFPKEFILNRRSSFVGKFILSVRIRGKSVSFFLFEGERSYFMRRFIFDGIIAGFSSGDIHRESHGALLILRKSLALKYGLLEPVRTENVGKITARRKVLGIQENCLRVFEIYISLFIPDIIS